jgi:hypothetical protein
MNTTAEHLTKMAGVTRADNEATALALRLAKTEGCHAEVLAAVKDLRAGWLVYLTRTQRKWQTNVSRRPQRGNHHDSWSIRESYVRCHR